MNQCWTLLSATKFVFPLSVLNNTRITFLWAVALCSLVCCYWHFCLHIQKEENPRNIDNDMPDYTAPHLTLLNNFTLTSQPDPGPTLPTDNHSFCGGRTAGTWSWSFIPSSAAVRCMKLHLHYTTRLHGVAFLWTEVQFHLRITDDSLVTPFRKIDRSKCFMGREFDVNTVTVRRLSEKSGSALSTSHALTFL
jgi:hypothetical protein